MSTPGQLSLGLLLLAGAFGFTEPARAVGDGDYVQVEIRGQLIVPSSGDGYVLVRVRKDGVGPGAALARTHRDWTVILPEDRDFREKTRRLAGKTVVVKGRLEPVFDVPGGLSPLHVHATVLQSAAR